MYDRSLCSHCSNTWNCNVYAPTCISTKWHNRKPFSSLEKHNTRQQNVKIISHLKRLDIHRCCLTFQQLQILFLGGGGDVTDPDFAGSSPFYRIRIHIQGMPIRILIRDWVRHFWNKINTIFTNLYLKFAISCWSSYVKRKLKNACLCLLLQ